MEQTKDGNERKLLWSDILALALSLCGATYGIYAAILVYVSQVTDFGNPVWPLPGLILLYWAMLGIIGLIASFLAIRQSTSKFPNGIWIIDGAFIPLVILGALSIGMMVLIGLLLLFISSLLLTIRRKPRLLSSMGSFILGILGSSGLLLGMIALWNPLAFGS